MPVFLITGPHQSGKSRRLWQRLRAEPPGAAALVRPMQGHPHDLLRQVHAWGGSGLLPPAWSFAELVERCAAAAEDAPHQLASGLAVHALRAWARTHLRGPWARLAAFRATGVELAELCRRLDDHGIGAGDIELAARTLRARGEQDLAACLVDAHAARAHLESVAGRRGATPTGARLRRIAASGGVPAVAALYFDDFQAFTPAELELLRALGERRTVVITAIDDARLGADSALAARLRAALPTASEERTAAIAAQTPHAPAVRAFVVDALEEGRRLDPAGVDRYRYRDPLHAGRAIAAWLRRNRVAPADALLVVRVADAAALALADALIAAEVPVSGRFQIPLLGTAAGARLAALSEFCQKRTWGAFLGLVERMPAAEPLPVRLADLAGPWAHLDLDAGLEHVQHLKKTGMSDGWEWGEYVRCKGDERFPALAAVVPSLLMWRDRLAAHGHWWQRFSMLARQLDLGDGGSGALRILAELTDLGPVASDDLAELLGTAKVEVARDGGHAALELTDAVRGRAWPRRVVLIHDLEHGRWPAAPRGGALLPLDERRALAGLLARDVYDEAGRAGGEIGAFLAVAGRATERVVLGIPCGDREPCAWLGTLCDQLGWDLEKLREDPGGEAVPGAPLSPVDSQGAHERALWSSAPGAPSFSFRVPPRDPQELGLRASGLGALFRDSFSAVCDRLELGEPLIDRELMQEGDELHRLLAKLAETPPAQWEQELGRLLPPWIADADDALARSERGRYARRLARVVADEALAAGAAVAREPEKQVKVTLPVPGHQALGLNGKIDRLDRLGDGTVRLVDYKRGYIAALAKALGEGIDGQLLAYLLAAQERGLSVAGAYYLSLRTGTRAGWGSIPTPSGKKQTKDGVDLATSAAAVALLGRAIAELAAGTAHADPEGSSAGTYAPIARLDESRLDMGTEVDDG